MKIKIQKREHHTHIVTYMHAYTHVRLHAWNERRGKQCNKSNKRQCRRCCCCCCFKRMTVSIQNLRLATYRGLSSSFNRLSHSRTLTSVVTYTLPLFIFIGLIIVINNLRFHIFRSHFRVSIVTMIVVVSVLRYYRIRFALFPLLLSIISFVNFSNIDNSTLDKLFDRSIDYICTKIE